MIKFLHFFTLMITIFSSCSCRFPITNMGDVIIANFANKAKKEQSLQLIGAGGSFQGGIKQLYLHFFSSQEIDVQQARKLIVGNVELLLDQINSSSEYRDYLEEVPFSYKRIELIIAFHNQSTQDYPAAPNIALVFASDGLVHYSVYNPIKDSLDAAHSESYQKALGIVQHQQSLENLAEMTKECLIDSDAKMEK